MHVGWVLDSKYNAKYIPWKVWVDECKFQC